MNDEEKKQQIKDDILLEMLGMNSSLTIMRNYYMAEYQSTEATLLKEMVKEGLVKQSKSDPQEIQIFKATRQGEIKAHGLKLIQAPAPTEE